MSASTPEEPQSNPRFLFHQPRALQWFEDGKLMRRQDGERQAGRFELFLDLLYVAILSNFADTLAEDISGAKLVKYILILAPSWNVWSDLRELMNAFYTDDLLQRILILWVMAVLVVYGNNAPLVDEEIGAMRSAVGSYMVARISCNLAHVFYSFASYHHRPQQRLWVVLSSLSLCIYIPLYFESVSIRGKIAAAAVAISVETMVWILCYSPAGKKLLRVRWSTAVDIAHEIDRFSAFYIIALGEFLYLIIVGSYAAVGLNKRLLRAVWTLVIAFCLNWLLLAGGHVAAQSVAEKEFEAPQRWLLCGGLGAGMIFLYVFALLHKSNDESGTLILDKPFRLIMRPAVGIITILLPLADHLNATDVLSIIMALFVFTLIWETITSLKKGACFWETWTDTDYPEDKPEVHNAKNEGTV
ncbi:hypothetical protein DTO013E5_6377 [Penicillium roqueforti]|uniref:uncharacterized protein n=1 Tax=Penicillium roqueforti TaxID=5082 RepID=UPI00190CE61D|nr:uncharacterized protein LCP9604111_5345 [Penicillium roqueforti]KAF9248595.1 hypothetical protein LCP9604111_5345 [Penicillium roqueforti]KAI1832222.1 hypothetical protein CBS147337_6902 [Penicillium roqueforti]KAI2674190.1 hypothetical protein CBS147355_7365 [Penicillium roqueforti]KAI2682044.1 hypothetical protein LCP963914a_6459 [Penicillium roqueforti]KAI2699177.1 hypothetical protein CBS147372_6424 [Penicillium roqueforti]